MNKQWKSFKNLVPLVNVYSSSRAAAVASCITGRGIQHRLTFASVAQRAPTMLTTWVNHYSLDTTSITIKEQPYVTKLVRHFSLPPHWPRWTHWLGCLVLALQPFARLRLPLVAPTYPCLYFPLSGKRLFLFGNLDWALFSWFFFLLRNAPVIINTSFPYHRVEVWLNKTTNKQISTDVYYGYSGLHDLLLADYEYNHVSRSV